MVSKSKILITIHNHAIDESIEIIDGSGQIICKCGYWFEAFITHADHVASKIFDLMEEEDNE